MMPLFFMALAGNLSCKSGRDPTLKRLRAGTLSKEDVCRRAAHFSVAGVPVCRAHAADLVLQAIVKREPVTFLEQET